MNLATPITGTGELVKTGDYTLYLRNAGTAGASTYSGGTVVGGGQLYVENARTLGTGNVSIPFAGARLSMTSASNIASGASVYIGGLPEYLPVINAYAYSGFLALEANMTPPTINPASTGVIALTGDTQSTPITSMGMCFLGSVDNISTYTATSLAADTDNTYRIGGTGFSGGGSGWIQQVIFASTASNNQGVLTGNDNVLFYEGGAKIYNIMNYTGTTTITWNMNSFAWNPSPVEAHLQVGGGELAPAAARST